MNVPRWMAVTVLTMLSAGCHNDTIVDNWPTFVVTGTISAAGGAPVAASKVQVTIWAPPLMCGDSIASTFAEDVTNSTGQYEVVLLSLSTSFTGCLRVRADTTQIDTALVAVRPNSRVHVDVHLP